MAKKVVYSDKNTRIAYITRIRTAEIFFKDVCVGTISEESNDAGEFDWVIRPNWSVLDKLPLYAQIEGIDPDLHLAEYVRRFVPIFVTNRSPNDNRDNLQEELAAVGLTYNDRFEFMCRRGNAGLSTSALTVKFKSDEAVSIKTIDPRDAEDRR